MSDNYTAPHYDLKELQDLVKNGNWIIPRSQFKEATQHGFSRTNIEDIVLSLTHEDFYKTMPAEKHPGKWQDVYKPIRNFTKVYVKLQKTYDDKKCVVISFKKA
jgi:hypothetical protein